MSADTSPTAQAPETQPPEWFNQADAQLDALGLRCPEPIMMLRLQMRKMQDGQTLALVADDPATARDVPSFCKFMQHTLQQAQTATLPYYFLLSKGV